MSDQRLTMVLFIAGQIVTVALAVVGWIVAWKLIARQLRQQQEDSIALDEERVRRDLKLRVVMEIVDCLYHLSDAGTRVSGTIWGMKAILPSMSRDIAGQKLFVDEAVPKFIEEWDGLQSAGAKFLTAAGAYEPIVHDLDSERGKLIKVIVSITGSRLGSAQEFLNRVREWILEPDSVECASAVSTALATCQSDFDKIHADLEDAIAAARTQLQNDHLAPLFGHRVKLPESYEGSVLDRFGGR